jgi:hypothetical protein
MLYRFRRSHPLNTRSSGQGTNVPLTSQQSTLQSMRLISFFQFRFDGVVAGGGSGVVGVCGGGVDTSFKGIKDTPLGTITSPLLDTVDHPWAITPTGPVFMTSCWVAPCEFQGNVTTVSLIGGSDVEVDVEVEASVECFDGSEPGGGKTGNGPGGGAPEYCLMGLVTS